MIENNTPTAAVIVIADEVLSGRTQDRNLKQLALWLQENGIVLRFACVVPDDRTEIIAAVRRCRNTYDHIFTVGGLGPTHDDITVEAIADALGRPLELHPVAEALLRRHLGDRLTEADLKLAHLPRGTEVVSSEPGKAGAIRVENIVILAGIPSIAAAMLANLTGRLGGGPPILSATIGTLLDEQIYAEALAAIQSARPECRIASYPLWRTGMGANIVIRGHACDVEACKAVIVAMIAQLGGEAIDGGIAREQGAALA